MVFFVVDVNVEQLNKFAECLKEICPDAHIVLHCNPATAVAAAVKIKPDYYITEAELGNTDGISLARVVKEKLRRVKICIMNDSSEYGLAAWQVHSEGYLLKPITTQKIRDDILWAAAPSLSS
ncbi:MAG: response regulator [Oscillospiraceae bacterium]|nr:response regulator [Oscillospiraceae bacterium]